MTGLIQNFLNYLDLLVRNPFHSILILFYSLLLLLVPVNSLIVYNYLNSYSFRLNYHIFSVLLRKLSLCLFLHFPDYIPSGYIVLLLAYYGYIVHLLLTTSLSQISHLSISCLFLSDSLITPTLYLFFVTLASLTFLFLFA